MFRPFSPFKVNQLYVAGAIATVCLAANGCSNRPDTKLKLPLGWFDSPGDHSYLKGNAKLAGWALSEDGIDSILVYVDRSFNEYAKMVGPRPDVLKVYPAFAGTDDVEWGAQLDTAAIPVGAHQIMVRAVTKKGAIRDLGTISVMIER